MSKAFVIGLITGLALLIVAGVGGSRLQKRIQRDDAEEKQYQAELVDATPVQLGVLTEQQRIHSKIYTYYKQMRHGETISGLITNAKSKRLGIVLQVGLDEVLTKPETPEDYFGRLADESDAIIRGRVVKKVSQITEDDAFIFTDYYVAITEVLKHTANSAVNSASTIIVTHPGGRVVVNGIIINAEDCYFSPLPINNHDVLLFLKFIPETATYRLTEHTGGFELNGKSLRPLTKDQFPRGVLSDGDSFLRMVRAISH